MATGAEAAATEPSNLQLDCQGVLQGVGFRPAVARLAAALGLSGTAVNVPGGVRLQLWGKRQDLQLLLESLPKQLPDGARLEALQPLWNHLEGPVPAGIALGCASTRPLEGSLVATALVADRAPCSRCLTELQDPTNRRYGYPFISCSSCGPRYSIATHEPFSRSGSTLAGFPLCDACQAEFDDPSNRRFHAETISCWTCGPRLRLLRSDGKPVAAAPNSAGPTKPLSEAVALLQRGAILAVQGVGGFQLLALARATDTVAALRQRKRRPHKPLALLIDEPQRLAALLQPSPDALVALGDPAAPIVLLPCPASVHGRLLPGIAPGAPALGVMLPASPLHWLLAQAVAAPLVATSGNRSGEPLCRDPEEALQRLAGIADAFLVHDRPIARRLDDSVLQMIDRRPALLRRSRGYAPEPLELPRANPVAADSPGPGGRPAVEGLLGLGGDLKAAPGLALGEQVWLAAHLGDLEDRRCQQLLAEGLLALAARWGGDVRAVVGDRHPDCLGRQLVHDLPQPIAWIGVQHHLAHALSVVAEHNLELPVLALCADGLGYGAPELGHQPALWGCELMWISAAGAERLASLRPLALPGGDQAQRQPRRIALGLLAQLGDAGLDHPGAEATLAAFEPAERQLLLQAIAAELNCPPSSSLGRLFDGVASILDLCQVQSYEGQGGLLLQGAADACRTRAGLDPYPLPLRPAPGLPLGWLNWKPLLHALLADRAEGRRVSESASRFHHGVSQGLAQLLGRAAGLRGCRHVVLAGGCFQNSWLLQRLVEQVRQSGLEPHWAERLPSNDGGLALGQIWAARLGLSITPRRRCGTEA